MVNATEPNHLEETFDYSLPPLIRFDGPLIEFVDHQQVECDSNTVKTRDSFVAATTFRDGQQARSPYSADQMVLLYDLMAKLGGPNGIIRQTEFFLCTNMVVLRLSVMGNWIKKFRNLCLMPGRNIETNKGSDQLFGAS